MSSLRVVAGIDGGSTKTRVQLRCAQTLTLVAEAQREGSTNLYQHGARGPEAVAALLDSLLSDCMDATHTLVAAVVGTAGIDAHGDADRHLAAYRQSEALRPLGPMLRVYSDVAPIDACGTHDHRVCVIAGTGSNTLAIRRREGQVIARHQVGGMDLALSDDGSAAWIGHHAMRASLRALQGVEPSALGEALLQHFQLPADIHEPWRALREVRLAISKADLAALTERIVVPLSEYDDVARALLIRAGDALASDILAAGRAIEAPARLEVLAVGGVWSSDLIRARATQHVVARHPDATLKRVDAATGAARLAQQLLDPS